MDKPKVLLVEDDLFLRELYVEALTPEPIELGVAEDGEQAFTKITETTWDLILLDVNLPKMNGGEVLKKIQAENPTAFPKKVIFLTNSEEARNSQDLLSMGQGFLVKTDLTPQDFVDQVKNFLH